MLFPVLLALLAFTLVAATTPWLRGWLIKRNVLDRPNTRSSHTIPTPRGGGLVVAPVVGAVWGLVAWAVPGQHAVLPIIAAGLGLFGLSWLDDRHSLSARVRLVCHALAVAIGVATLPATALVFQGMVPLWLDRALILLAWVWFINLTNFMDGIDGITGAEVASVALGLAGLAVLTGVTNRLPYDVILAGAALGFLVWNWHPAKLFLGDSGSIPLGYWLGWLLIDTASHGHWAAAVILPLYYLADATLTLLARLARREKVWQAHREHFYQRAAAQVGRHDYVVLVIASGNTALVAAALLAEWQSPWLGLVLGVVTTVAMLWMLRHLSRLPER